jgi:hypothetical protein
MRIAFLYGRQSVQLTRRDKQTFENQAPSPAIGAALEAPDRCRATVPAAAGEVGAAVTSHHRPNAPTTSSVSGYSASQHRTLPGRRRPDGRFDNIKRRADSVDINGFWR